MFRSFIPPWWPHGLREKLEMDSKKRFMLLLIFFNTLLVLILLFSVRNREIRQSIRVIEEQIKTQIEQLATIQAHQTRVVYITATPSPAAVALLTPTSTAAPPPSPTPTATETSSPPTPTRTSRPTRTPRPTAAPSRTGPAAPTSTLPVAPSQTPTPTVEPTWTPTLVTATPTWTPTATGTVPPTPIPVPASLYLTSSTTDITADGTSTLAIRAHVSDQLGNPVPDGTQVTFTTDRGTFWGATTVTVLTTGGIAEAMLTSSTAAGTATVRATAGTASGSVAITFSPGDPHTVVLSADRSQMAIGETATLSAVVTDSHGNSVRNGTIVHFSTTLGTLQNADPATQGGIASTLFTSNAAGQATITARAGTGADTVTILVMPSVTIAKSVNRPTAPAGSVLTYTLSIQNTSLGGDPARLLALSDQIAPGFSYVPGSMSSAAFAGDPTWDGTSLIWALSSAYGLASGNTLAATFQVIALAGVGSYANAATVSGENFLPASTGETAWVDLLAPAPVSIEPNTACNNVPVRATIRGSNLADGATAHLGAWPLAVTWVNEQQLDVTIPRLISAGTYDLIVTNPGGAAGTLPAAYTALNCGATDTTLDSGYLGTYGAEPYFAANQGDDDQLQVIFMEVPASTSQPLYIRIFDPDCGGTLDIQNGWRWDTPFTYTVYGGSGTYTLPDARSAHPAAGASSGTVLATATFAEDPSTDGTWYTMGPFDVGDGEYVGTKRIFKLTVVGGPKPPFAGGSRADLNVYNVALSTIATGNNQPQGARLLGFSWTFLIPAQTYNTPPRMFAYVDAHTTTLAQHNWDYDNDTFGPGAAGITITTPIRTIQVLDADVSSDGEERTSSYAVLDGEHNTTWAISSWAEPTGALADNLVTFWATDQQGAALALFARSTIEPPP